ncbi:ABC transporter ATP-binding protein [Tenuifilum sp.]|jgi:putative ABC transport system ATP-binding protein|uniref:ABC transporter ATP-binding protein n=1 Tax=Tenuifilum sp. TaxID=2760880 RepID=UPI001B79E0ED|nr:ABC transporter ATP-binding protein [Bacteroidales bacterium]HOK85238.1 ABC transporter ATP-binding protein [Tenuifilum sp.]MBP9030166.1 ABC transporter ATP-binding protein [Bacteroidales bacterium]HPP90550.1 ABC transporter ATP-binding protein [Tenuifilum sp.]HQE55674.1 ABC transporter ATP-binding protein [Tenuifilum sp.]
MAIIEVVNVDKIYNDSEVKVTALSNINLTIEKGEFTAIVGPSGSGKTTLLNLLGGLDSPTNGKIRVGDVWLNELKGSKLIDFRLRNIGFVFQSYNLIPVLTAGENVELIMQLQGVPAKLRKQVAADMLGKVGLADRFASRPAKLSGGQQQRVAVARALASKPQFILADEPTANLDGKSAENLLQIMEHLNQTEGVTFIFSTHDQRVVNRARRVILLEDGKVKSDTLQ